MAGENEEKEITPAPTLLDAVSAAVTPPEAPKEEPKVEDAPPEGEEPVIEPAKDEDEKSPEGDEDADADAKKDADKSAEEPAKAEGEEKPAKEPKPVDPMNDPIDPRWSERTQDRFRALSTMVKERDTAIATQQELFTTIKSTGVTAENFAQTLSFLRAFNSDNIEDRRSAYNFMMSQVKALAADLGEVLPGTNPLEGHKDLTEEVTAGKLTQERAIELATVRNRNKATETARAATGARQTEQQAFETDRIAAVQGLNALQASLRADPDYDRKYALLVGSQGEPGTMHAVLSAVHPSRWVEVFQKAWTNCRLGPAAPASVARPAQQPMRPNKQPAGQGAAKPNSMAAAIDMALKDMGGG